MAPASETWIKKYYFLVTHMAGRISRRYYFEDYMRVYPDGLVYHKWGKRRAPTRETINNFRNHQKFYEFAGQFVKDKLVADIGCGSGHGCELLKHSGATKVYGADLSRHGINFAKKRYGDLACFSVQGVTNMDKYQEKMFDVAVMSEVLEHIKEYGLEQKAISEIKRITRDAGMIIISTPNTELSDGHGFEYDELDALFHANFQKYCIFENALKPSQPEHVRSWQNRLKKGKVGVVVSEAINLEESAFLPEEPSLKSGLEPGSFRFASFNVDTTLLHNTHSWVALAINGT